MNIQQRGTVDSKQGLRISIYGSVVVFACWFVGFLIDAPPNTYPWSYPPELIEPVILAMLSGGFIIRPVASWIVANKRDSLASWLVAGVVVGWLANGCFLFVRTIEDMTGYRPLLMQEFSWRHLSVEGSVSFALLSVVYAAIAAIFRKLVSSRN
jgi:hypothetical protein